MDEQWRQQRDHAVAQHAAADERRRAAEVAKARVMIERFVTQARERGLRTTALTAFAYDGGGRYRTGLRGWYVHRGRGLAVDVDGNYYVLGVPSSLRARLLGAQVAPSDPPLVIGAGGKDGESMPLEVMLRRRLDAGDD
ncbi:hypothetical protein [Catellatospora tritici]|uniref:hypothetical protein n=1 Tax=Catellatospora tritici TaxID=2851566 RepID=UPI001C2D9F43|nr:hypothetical protein [Catellatospora tritici]MBV1851567.1 hypothetical protein [Catellatospora tritici]